MLYHSLNGIRISVIDFWPASTVYHKQMFTAVALIFLLVFIPVAVIMLGHVFHGGPA